jgi:hypothetical protein
MSPPPMAALMQLGMPEQLFAFGVLGHDGGQVFDGEFERRLSVAPPKGPAVEAVGDGMVGFAVNALFTGMLRLAGRLKVARGVLGRFGYRP